MITKQISTYDKKIERAKEILAIKETRVKNNEKLINLIDKFAKEQKDNKETSIQIQLLQNNNLRLDCLESIIENEINIRIQKEILEEDMKAHNRLLAEREALTKEINDGKWDEYVENLKVVAMNIRRKNPKADLSRVTNAISRSFEPMQEDEQLDHFKLLKQLQNIKA